MPTPPIICTEECHTKRIHLYLFYSVFLASLLLLALIHFVFFLLSRRRTKYEARDYATRKLEFVTLGIPDTLPPTNQKAAADGSTSTMDEENLQLELKQASENLSTPPQPSTSSSALSFNRLLAMNDEIGTVTLQTINEESLAVPRESSANNQPLCSSSSESINRGKTVVGALQEPVVVTVATVSALFQQQHEGNEMMEQPSRSHSTESMSSVLDISDLVNSPSSSVAKRNNAREDADVATSGDWAPGTECRSKKSQMLDVRMGGGKRGFLKSHRGEQPLKESILSTDAIFPANDSGGIYDTEQIA